MMIGPAPMMRMLWMSVRLGIFGKLDLLFAPDQMAGGQASARDAAHHGIEETVEQVGHVVRARARFRVSLEGKGRHIGAGDALQANRRTATCVGRRLAGSESGSTAKPWFWLVISTCPVSRS